MNNSEINGQYSRIESSTKFKGDIISKADFRIDGELDGTIKTKGKLIVGKNGKINGTVYCNAADIEGLVKGSLKITNTLSLKSSSIIEGDVFIGKLIVEAGATFNANCSMISAKENAIKKISKFSNSHEKTA
jgi:cytoskeletal protein CcmA (bactofilin family)